MPDFLTTEMLTALFQVIMIDLVLAGDNAIVIGLAAAGLPQEQRAKAILVGIIAATVLRIGFAALHHAASADRRAAARRRPSAVVGVLEDVARTAKRRAPQREREATEVLTDIDINADGTIAGRMQRKTFAQAAWQIVIADVSMSLDNVLAVAGAAREHPYVLRVRPRPVDRADGYRRELSSPSFCRSIAGSPMSASPSSSTWRSR